MNKLLLLLQNNRSLWKIAKLIKSGFKDWLFYLILFDFVLTKIIINSGVGFEANPIVDFMGNNFAILLSLFIYFFLIPKKKDSLVRILLIGYYLFLNIHHFGILYNVSWIVKYI